MAGEKGTTSVDTEKALKQSVADPEQIRAERMEARAKAFEERPGCLKAIDRKITCFCETCVKELKAAQRAAKKKVKESKR